MDQRENFGRPWQRLSRGRPTVLLTSFQPPPLGKCTQRTLFRPPSRPPASNVVRAVHDVLKTVICFKLTTFIIEGKAHRSVAFQLSHSGNNCNIQCNVV